MHEGVIDRLCPAPAAVSRHDRSNHVDKLCEAGNLDSIGVAKQRDQHGANQQRILKVVDILQQRKCTVPFLPFPDFLILFVGMIPDIPLVKREVDLLFAVLLPLDRVADRDHALDELVHIHGPCQETRCVSGRVPIISVKRDIVDVVIAFVEHAEFPVAERWHLGTGGAACHDFNGRVDPFHHFRSFIRDMTVFIRCFLSHLPGAVHLVAETPESDPERFLLSICDAHIRELAVPSVVGILHKVSGLFRTTRSEIHSVHDFAVDTLRPPCKFMESDFVGLRSKPCKIQPFRTALNWPYTVLPVEAGNEVSSRIPNQGDTQLFDCFHHIRTKARFVCQRMSWLINTTVNSTAEMFDKGAE